MVRNSLKFVPFKERKAIAADLKKIYSAPSEELAVDELETFSKRWDSRYPMISRSWKFRWSELTSFFKSSEMIQKVIYTTNAIESLYFSVRKGHQEPAEFLDFRHSDEASVHGLAEYFA
jgi:transposase-like protein